MSDGALIEVLAASRAEYDAIREQLHITGHRSDDQGTRFGLGRCSVRVSVADAGTDSPHAGSHVVLLVGTLENRTDLCDVVVTANRCCDGTARDDGLLGCDADREVERCVQSAVREFQALPGSPRVHVEPSAAVSTRRLPVLDILGNSADARVPGRRPRTAENAARFAVVVITLLSGRRPGLAGSDAHPEQSFVQILDAAGGGRVYGVQHGDMYHHDVTTPPSPE